MYQSEKIYIILLQENKGLYNMSLINKDFKKDWQNTSQEDKKHVIKMIILLAALTLVPVAFIAFSMATGAMWINEP